MPASRRMATPVVTKTAWKLQEIVAHASNVSSLVLGKGSGRLLATGGDDCRVNLWSINKPNCIMSLTGHTSPVESVRLNTPEELIVAGSQSGSIRVWDLEAAKILRTLMGHKANICSLDFHPYGEFVASGSQDTNIKLWDIRRKGCVFRYRGHSQAVRCLRFSPDGKWLASAADDHTVKLWDLTAGKMMSEFPGHTGPVNVVEFHPNEYLLASGSSDRTIRFWDLEKFQVVSCIEGEPGPVRSVLFNPDGCCLYSGCQDSLRVYGWEPERCFDVVLVNWGKVADLAICNNQLVRKPPSTLSPRLHPLPPQAPTHTHTPAAAAEGPAPALLLPADRCGLLPEQRLLLRGGPDSGHQDRHGGPGPRAGQPAAGTAAAPSQCPPPTHLRAARHSLQQASEGKAELRE